MAKQNEMSLKIESYFVFVKVSRGAGAGEVIQQVRMLAM